MVLNFIEIIQMYHLFVICIFKILYYIGVMLLIIFRIISTETYIKIFILLYLCNNGDSVNLNTIFISFVQFSQIFNTNIF